jgi:hypothetical protein
MSLIGPVPAHNDKNFYHFDYIGLAGTFSGSPATESASGLKLPMMGTRIGRGDLKTQIIDAKLSI